MKKKYTKMGFMLIIFILIFGMSILLLNAQSTSTDDKNQNPIIQYSLTPVLLLQNIVIMPSSNTGTSSELISVMIDITILRPSYRD
jgi:hypothetical protein